jgi:hypothetical protein
MTETRDLVLGGRTFAVPRFPLGMTLKFYPLLRKLANNGFLTRWLDPNDIPSDQDMTDLSTVLFAAAQLGDPTLTPDAFDALPASPSELFDALLIARYQSGGWVPAAAEDAGGASAAGEGAGEPTPPKSTSAESLAG